MKQYIGVQSIIKYIILTLSLIPWIASSNTVIYSVSNPSEYNKEYLVDNYSADLDSNLSLFPDRISDDAENVNYTATLKNNFFDTDAVIILECTYSEQEYENEIERISNLSATIQDSDGSEYTNHVFYDKECYPEPSYITIDGFANTYEYALIDDDLHNIIYIYLAYPSTEDSYYSKYLKNDTSIYDDENTLKYWSMYNHSFDGGHTWVEITDM